MNNDGTVDGAERRLAAKETLQRIEADLGTLRSLVAATDNQQAKFNGAASGDTQMDGTNPFSESHPVDSLPLIADGTKLVTTILATAGDGDMELTRRDLHGLALVTYALRAAIDHECKRVTSDG